MWNDSNDSIVAEMRRRMHEGCTVSGLLRHITALYLSGVYDGVLLSKALSNAFHLSIGVVGCVRQWRPSGDTTLCDLNLNRFLIPEIMLASDRWAPEGVKWMGGMEAAADKLRVAYDEALGGGGELLVVEGDLAHSKQAFALGVFCRLCAAMESQAGVSRSP